MSENKVVGKANVAYVFIDASNLWQAQKAKGRMFDYQKLKSFLKTKFSASAFDVLEVGADIWGRELKFRAKKP